MTAPLPDVAEVGADNAAHMAEQALLGAVLLLRGQDARDALARVEVTDLADPQHRAIWTAMRSLSADDLDPEPVLVCPRLLELGLLTRDRSGLVNVQLVDLMGLCPTPAIWQVYAAAVLRESARRTVVEVCTRAVQASEGPDLADRGAACWPRDWSGSPTLLPAPSGVTHDRVGRACRDRGRPVGPVRARVAAERVLPRLRRGRRPRTDEPTEPDTDTRAAPTARRTLRRARAWPRDSCRTRSTTTPSDGPPTGRDRSPSPTARTWPCRCEVVAGVCGVRWPAPPTTCGDRPPRRPRSPTR